MSHENQQLPDKCRQFWIARKINNPWVFNSVLKIKFTEHVRVHQIFHVTDIENLVEIDNLEEYINNLLTDLITKLMINITF